MRNELYKQAFHKWGVTSQLTVAIEELSELIKEICKFERGTYDIDNIAEEIADVEIMCEQLRYYFQLDHEVAEWKHRKLTRLKDRLQ